MRFLPPCLRRRSTTSDHFRRPAPAEQRFLGFDERASLKELVLAEDQALLEFVVDELGEDPTELFLRTMASRIPDVHEAIARSRRVGKPRVGMRRRPAGGCP